jgi:hypothetical protein
MNSFGKIGKKYKKMDFTFGIITNNGIYIGKIIDSIKSLNIKNYEIIIVGSYIGEFSGNIRFIEYKDDSINFNISIKKNLISKESKYENIVFLHDYIIMDKNWYDGFLKFGNDFDVCMTKIYNSDGTRYRDWCLWKDDVNNFVKKNNYLIPYNIKSFTKFMYISGSYWVSKKNFMIENPLNEKLKWGQGEDVEWSIRIREKTEFKLNTHSSVTLILKKDRIFNEMDAEDIMKLSNVNKNDNVLSYNNLIENHISKWIK